jgi:hypothetical protein
MGLPFIPPIWRFVGAGVAVALGRRSYRRRAS